MDVRPFDVAIDTLLYKRVLCFMQHRHSKFYIKRAVESLSKLP